MKGVGTLIALAFLLTLEDAHRPHGCGALAAPAAFADTKGGDSGDSVGKKQRDQQMPKRSDLIPTRLLIEGAYIHNPGGEQPTVGWGISSRKSQAPQKVTTGRFGIERDGKVAYLEYTMTGSVLGLIHTVVPTELRGLGLASSLAATALQYALKNGLKVDVICPSVLDYLAKHPEYSHLALR